MNRYVTKDIIQEISKPYQRQTKVGNYLPYVRQAFYA